MEYVTKMGHRNGMTLSQRLSERPMNKGGQSMAKPQNLTQGYQTKEKQTGKNVTRATLACAVGELLEIPFSDSRYESYKIVSAVIASITNALRNGDTVKIVGLGKFVPKPRTIYNRSVGVLYNGQLHGRYTLKVKPGMDVYFYPSDSILRTLNE